MTPPSRCSVLFSLSLSLLLLSSSTHDCAAFVITNSPVRGFNSWVVYGCGVSDVHIRATADAIVARGLGDLYPIVALDDCWALENRSATTGELQADPKTFPYGMANLSAYVNSRGLSFGIYTSIGTTTCAERAGSAGHELTDAATFARWNVTFIKADNCNRSKVNPSGSWTVDTAVLYRKWAAALAAQPYPITLATKASINYTVAQSVGQSRRVGFDISASFRSILLELYMATPLWMQARAGDAAHGVGSFWTDIELLVSGLGRLTPMETRYQFYAWCALHAPLLLSVDIATMTADTLRVVSNRAAIAIDADPLGRPARLVQLDAVANASLPTSLTPCVLTCSDPSLIMPGQQFVLEAAPSSPACKEGCVFVKQAAALPVLTSPSSPSPSSSASADGARSGLSTGSSAAAAATAATAGWCMQSPNCDGNLVLAPCPSDPSTQCQGGAGLLFRLESTPTPRLVSLLTGHHQLCLTAHVPSVSLSECDGNTSSPWQAFTFNHSTLQLAVITPPPYDFNGYHLCLDSVPTVHVETYASPLHNGDYTVLVLNPSNADVHNVSLFWGNVSISGQMDVAGGGKRQVWDMTAEAAPAAVPAAPAAVPAAAGSFSVGRVVDVDSGADLGVAQEHVVVDVPSHGVRLLRVTPLGY